MSRVPGGNVAYESPLVSLLAFAIPDVLHAAAVDINQPVRPCANRAPTTYFPFENGDSHNRNLLRSSPPRAGRQLSCMCRKIHTGQTSFHCTIGGILPLPIGFGRPGLSA